MAVGWDHPQAFIVFQYVASSSWKLLQDKNKNTASLDLVAAWWVNPLLTTGNSRIIKAYKFLPIIHVCCGKRLIPTLLVNLVFIGQLTSLVSRLGQKMKASWMVSSHNGRHGAGMLFNNNTCMAACTCTVAIAHDSHKTIAHCDSTSFVQVMNRLAPITRPQWI